MNTSPIIPLVGAGILALGGYKLFQKLGLLKTKEDRETEKNIESAEKVPDSANFFSPTAKIPKGSLLLTAAGAAALAKKLMKARGFFNDDEEAIYGIFRSLKTRSQITSLAFAFQKLYGKDLYFWLKAIMSAGELAVVVKIVNSKPKYKLNG